MTMKRIHREITDLKKEDLGALTLAPAEDSLFLWKGTIPGPEGSVYEGGVFNLDVMLAPDYPCVVMLEPKPRSNSWPDLLHRKWCSRPGKKFHERFVVVRLTLVPEYTT
jgi:hypothetical protein